MINVDLRALIQPLGILRVIEVVLSCLCFSLVASVGHVLFSYWAWCMFTWCFCCFSTLLILILEFTTLSSKVPFAWDDFTTAFAMLAGLMYLSASIIYPSFYPSFHPCSACPRQISASVVSWVCFGVYIGEVVLNRLRPRGETIGFLSTVPGIMKMLETFIACLIFISLDTKHYVGIPALSWCVSVYSLCFIFSLVIILLTLVQLTMSFPFPFDKLVIVYNILAAVVYVTAMVIWPLYSFNPNYRKPTVCDKLCHDKQVVVTVMTVFNFIIYTLDSIYAVHLVFFTSSE